MSIVFAIPSYKRVEILKTKTLETLKSYNISEKSIYIFCANKEELKIYQDNIDSSYNILLGVPKLYKQRNFISNYFKEGQKIVYMDDDIGGITELSKPKLKRLPNLMRFLDDAFAECKENNAYLFGVYPVDNHYFMRKTITKDLRYIIGAFYGVINRKSKDLKLWLEEKEDVLRTIQFYKKDGVVIRYNFIGIKTKYFGDGGMSVGRDRIKEGKIAVQKLHRKYPTFTRIKLPTKSHPYYELSLLKNKI